MPRADLLRRLARLEALPAPSERIELPPGWHEVGHRLFVPDTMTLDDWPPAAAEFHAAIYALEKEAMTDETH